MKQGCKNFLRLSGCLPGVLLLLATVRCELLQSAGNDPEAASWQISPETVFPDGKPANVYIQELVDALNAQTAAGAPVSEQELRDLVQRAATVVYHDRVIKYATPLSVNIQNREHEDFSKIFLKPKRIAQGVAFMQTHDSTLAKAQQRYRVRKQDVVAILMWESGLGEFTGDHLIFNILLGQLLYLEAARDVAVTHLIAEGEMDSSARVMTAPERARLQRLRKSAVRNLAALIRLGKEKGYDAVAVKGSWGGAIGYVQFMPSSMQFAADGDGDGRIDLCTWPDAIFSVANYLHKNGYRDSERSRRRAIHAYNPLDSYVNGVVKYADAVWKGHESSLTEN